jgi:hypothetical protein
MYKPQPPRSYFGRLWGHCGLWVVGTYVHTHKQSLLLAHTVNYPTNTQIQRAPTSTSCLSQPTSAVASQGMFLFVCVPWYRVVTVLYCAVRSGPTTPFLSDPALTTLTSVCLTPLNSFVHNHSHTLFSPSVHPPLPERQSLGTAPPPSQWRPNFRKVAI